MRVLGFQAVLARRYSRREKINSAVLIIPIGNTLHTVGAIFFLKIEGKQKELGGIVMMQIDYSIVLSIY